MRETPKNSHPCEGSADAVLAPDALAAPPGTTWLGQWVAWVGENSGEADDDVIAFAKMIFELIKLSG